MFKERFQTRLEAQKQAFLYRTAPDITQREGKYLYIEGQRVINFASNDYLGLGGSDGLRAKVSRNFRKYPVSSSSSRLVSGNYSLISQAEHQYAAYFGYEDALFFPSGYQANLGVLSTLFEKGDIIVFDKHIHASSIKGMALSGAEFRGYNHNSMAHLQKRIETATPGRVAVLTESLFSMDGDLLDVEAFGKLKTKYGFLSVVDEAHAFGVLGQRGRGLCTDVADVAVGTFGKALGLFGAFVLLPGAFKEYLFNFCSPLIYTTTLPEAHAASAMDILEIINQRDDLRQHLAQISFLLKQSLLKEGFSVSGDAHILSVHIGEEGRAVEIANALLACGIFVLPARFPTVPLHQAILRVSLSSLHTDEDVAYFARKLREVAGAEAGGG
jgi:8-amino-7-oxononanoate synthase